MNGLPKLLNEKLSTTHAVERDQSFSQIQRGKLIDLAEDLRELKFLINDLDDITEPDQNPEAPNPKNSWLYPQYAHTLKVLKARYRRLVQLIENATRWADSESLDSLLQSGRHQYHSVKAAIRVAYRQKGVLLCASDWQSPIYGYSHSSFSLTNHLSQGIKEHSLDYKRDGHLDAKIYEENFIEEYTSHLGSSKATAYLTNCGMAAFTTVLHWVASEFASSAMAVEPMYFENIHLAKNFFPALIQAKPSCTQELLEQLNEHKPSVVIVDTVTNCGEVMSHDFQAVLQWAKTEVNRQIALIIDTTCLPSLFLPANLFSDMPDNISIFLVESLAKYHQFGMDLVTGGVVIAHTSKENHLSFRKTRARLGTNIVDGSVGSLPRPSFEMLSKRLKRHSRNASLLAECIQYNIQEYGGVINSVSWLDKTIDNTPEFNGSCLTLRFDERFRSIDNHLEFENRIIEMAREAKLLVALSTSFGFDITRLAITAPATLFEAPFMRVSIGTESANEIKLLTEIINRASLDLFSLWNDKLQVTNLSVPEKINNLIHSPLRVISKNKIKQDRKFKNDSKGQNVFSGEDGLKNYLCPENYVSPPLVELPCDLNPFKTKNIRIFAKMMSLVPLMNIKSLPAFSMLSEAEARNNCKMYKSIIESSSSNTVLSLSVMAKLFGINSTCAIVDHSIAPSLLNMLRLFGIEIYLHPAQGHEAFGHMEPRSSRATNFGKQDGCITLVNILITTIPKHSLSGWPPIFGLKQKVSLILSSCALGTCGTMVGVSRGLREFNPSIKVVANCPRPGNSVPGPRELSLLADVLSLAKCS